MKVSGKVSSDVVECLLTFSGNIGKVFSLVMPVVPEKVEQCCMVRYFLHSSAGHRSVSMRSFDRIDVTAGKRMQLNILNVPNSMLVTIGKWTVGPFHWDRMTS